MPDPINPSHELQLEPAHVVGELMRIYSGRISLYRHCLAMDWLVANGFATEFAFDDALITELGKRLAEKLIALSGVAVMMMDLE